MPQIGIIGGGISGLTLAYLLREKGHEVCVYEASGQTGGAIKTTRDNGWMAEWGPNTILESSGRIKKLISMLDLEKRRYYTDERAKKRYIVRDQRMIPVPESLNGLLRTPLLSRKAKWNLLREPFVSRRPEILKGSFDDESLAEFVRRRLGEEFLKWPVDALVGGIFAGDPEKLSVRHAFPRLALLEEQHGSLLLGQLKGGVRRQDGSDEVPRNKARAFSFDEGLQLLPQTITEKLGNVVLCDAEIKSVSHAVPEYQKIPESNIEYEGHKHNARWEVSFKSREKSSESFDILIYAGTSHSIGNISFPPEMTSDLHMLAEITHPPVASLTLGFRRSEISHPLDGFGVLVPGIEKLPILGTLFTSSLFPGRSPGHNYVTLTTYLGGMRQPEIAYKREDEQIKLVCESLAKLTGLSGSPLFKHRTFWPKAIPQYHIGHLLYLDRMDRIEKNSENFYFAGNYRTGISVGDSINAAFDLAERISEKLRSHVNARDSGDSKRKSKA